MALSDAARECFLRQAESCRALGSPFTARLLTLLAEGLSADSRFGARIEAWSGDRHDDAVPLRAAAALHALKRTGDPGLAAVYPPASADDATLSAALEDAVSRADDALAAWLDGPPQTNEIGRSAVLLGALLHLAAETRMPLTLWEIGASAGLNLRLDRYRYRLGADQPDARTWGAADAAVAIRCAWEVADEARDAPPLDAPLRIADRAGCDLRPLDPADPNTRERLLAYIWADQTERLIRAELALALSAADGLKIEQADAADWLAARLAEPAPSGRVRAVLHTVMWRYMPQETRARIEAMLAEAGRDARADAPLAHLSVEPDETRGSARIALTLWDGSASAGRPRTLGRAHFHGLWARWSGG
ncbi:MAG: DUF2332 family protein [Pseudomonadota bacterium]